MGPLPPAAEEGAYGHLEKPVEVPELRMLVTQALTVEARGVSRAPRTRAQTDPPAS